MEQVITIRSNDPARPEQRVTIHYSVGASHIEFEPAFVDFGRVMRSELPADRSAAVRLPLQADASPLAKRQISIGALDSTLFTTRTIQHDGSQSVVLTLLRSAPSGEFSSFVRCTDALTQETKELQVTGFIRGEFYAQPMCVVIERERASSGDNHAEIVQILSRSESNAGATVSNVITSSNIAPLLSAASISGNGSPRIEFRARAAPTDGSRDSGARLVGFVRATVIAKPDVREDVNIPVEIMTHRAMARSARKEN